VLTGNICNYDYHTNLNASYNKYDYYTISSNIYDFELVADVRSYGDYIPNEGLEDPLTLE
jgi:hypothetical protein